jgi:hypothetical protein
MSATAEIVTRKHKEVDSRSINPRQKPDIEMPSLDVEMERTPELVAVETPLLKADYDKLAFNEEPVTILIHRSGEKFSPGCTDLISINGTKAEMLFKNGWVQIGYLPRGIGITTKRKYVEALAGAKTDTVSTRVIEHDGEDPRNTVERVTVNVCAFSVLEDKNPIGAEWLGQLLRRN